MSQKKAKKRFKEQRPLADGVSRLLDIYHMRRTVDDLSLIESWHEIVGERIAGFTKPLAIDQHRILHVEVSDSSWMHELSFLKQPIMDGINDYRVARDSPPLPIRSIRFFLDRS